MAIPFTFTLLGTGTSQGVPVIGCECEVCRSENPKDQRLRCAAWISSEGKNVVIDAGPDFREQMLRIGIKDLEAILLTHEHGDHIAGLEDTRPFVFRKTCPMPLYGLPRTLQAVKDRYDYAFSENPYPGAVALELKEIDFDSWIEIPDFPIKIQIIRINHGELPILGFRIGNVAYLTDCKTIPETEFPKLHNLETLVLDALHHAEHHSHLTLAEAVQLAQRIRAKQTYFIHCSHHIGKHDTINQTLPDNMALGYDGLQIKAIG